MTDKGRIPTTSYRAKTPSEIETDVLNEILDEIEGLRKVAILAPDDSYKAGYLKAITNINAIIKERKA
jgi:hypothetical protein